MNHSHCTSVSLVTTYKSLITSLNATSHVFEKKLSVDLIWHLTEEYNTTVLEENINKSNAAMVAAVAKMQGTGSYKTKKDEKYCTNCKKTSHMKEDCWSKGGRKEGQGPKQKGKKKKTANTAESPKTAVIYTPPPIPVESSGFLGFLGFLGSPGNGPIHSCHS